MMAAFLSVLMIISIVPMTIINAYAESNEKIIYDFFINNMKVNQAVACGALGNIKAESNFSPTSSYTEKDGSLSYGICQWNGSRLTDLKNYCKKNNLDYTTLNAQLKFLQFELNGSKSAVWTEIKKQSNTSEGAYKAGYLWAQKFEVCVSSQFSYRAELAQNMYWPKYSTHSNYSFNTNSYFVAVSVNNITENDAQIVGTLPTIKSISSAGFYIGTSESNLKKISKGLSGQTDGAANCQFISYTMSKWYGNLTAGTKYYYKIYYVASGKEYCTPVNWFVTSGSSGGSGGSTSAVNFTSVWADNITKTDAQINANFDLTYISGCGFYIGTSSSSLKKVSKNLAGQADGAGNFKNIFYKMSKWYGTLSPNTTYYYKLYVIKDGKEYCTAVKSFKTLPNTYTVSYNANGGSGAPASQTKTQGTTLKLSTTIPTRSGYIFKGWATSSSGSVVYNAGGSYTKDAAITLYAVWEKIATVTGVSINENYVNANMSLGETVLFEATVYPQNAENKNLIWSSPSENVSVSEDGCVTALDCGEAEIIVTTEDGGFSDSVFIYIWHEVGGIDISEDSLALGLGESYDLSYEVYSEGECLYMAEWVSSDESVVTVDESGTVTPVGEGTATVTLVVTDVAHINYSVQFEDSVEITVSDVSHEEKSILDIILGILMAPVNLIVSLFKAIIGLFK